MVSVWIKRLSVVGLLLLLLCTQSVSAKIPESSEVTQFSFLSLWDTVKDMLWGEFALLQERLPSLMALLMLIGIKNCMEFPVSLTRTVHLGIFCALALTSGELFRELSGVAEDCITHLSEFVYMTIPVLTGLIANGGKVLSAAKSTYLILGFMSLLVFLIKHIFLPGIFVHYMCVMLSPLLEGNYFDALKKMIVWSIKTVLPILVGIFLTVFTLMVSVTKASDSLTLQSAKLALGNCIPFLGGTLSDSGEYLIQTMSQIKAQAGLTGVITVSYVFLAPLVKLVAGLLTFRGLSVCAGFLSDENTACFFEDTATGMGMLTGVVATVSVVTVLDILILLGI